MFSNEKFTIYNNQEFLNLRQLYTKLEKYIECTDNAYKLYTFWNKF